MTRAAALELPPTEVLDDGDTEVAVETPEVRVRLAAALQGSDNFRVVCDPWSNEAPVVGSLSDCAGDIYRDLREGLAILAEGRREEAVWSWRFSFNNHWGRHAVEALSAIYALTRPGQA